MPFWSFMLWYVNFRDPAAGLELTLFVWPGGLPALTRMTRLFFQKHVPGDPVLAPLFANAPSGLPEQMAAWLGEVFGGPPSHGRAHGGGPPNVPPPPRGGLKFRPPSPLGRPLHPHGPQAVLA